MNIYWVATKGCLPIKWPSRIYPFLPKIAYRQTSNISRLVLRLSLPNPFNPGVKSKWISSSSSANSHCNTRGPSEAVLLRVIKNYGMGLCHRDVNLTRIEEYALVVIPWEMANFLHVTNNVDSFPPITCTSEISMRKHTFWKDQAVS